MPTPLIQTNFAMRNLEVGLARPTWEAAQSEDWLGRWAMNLMLTNVSTRRFGRAVRLPEGDCAFRTIVNAGSGDRDGGREVRVSRCC